MQAAFSPEVEQDIQYALANESSTRLGISSTRWIIARSTPLTVNDARRIIACLENPRFDTLEINYYSFHDPAVLNVFRDGLRLCASLTTVSLCKAQLTHEDVERLRPAFYNTSVRKLSLSWENDRIQGQRGGEVLRDLLVGNDTLHELILSRNPISPEAAIGFGQGLTNNHGLQILNLSECEIGNDFLANFLLPTDGMINNSLLHLDLSWNNIEGEDGGRQITLLLHRFPALKVLLLNFNGLGPLGARALAPGLAAASHLQSLGLWCCGLENDCVANIVPEGQVNRSLTMLDLDWNNTEEDLAGGENVVALASRCTNLDSLDVDEDNLSPDQRRHLSLLLDRKRLFTKASALGGSTFPVLFRAVEEAHHHEQGLSAIFVILQNDGDDYFCTALNRAID